MAEIDAQITMYLSAIEVEGKMPRTRASYSNSLADFRRAGHQLGLPDAAQDYRVTDVYAFLTALRARGCSPAFQHRRHREVKACFSWFRRMGIVDENVFARVPLVKRPQVIKPPFSPPEVDALLANQDPSTHFGARNYALLLFLLDTGVRASELVALTFADINWETRRANVRHGKGDKQRWVGFGARTSAALEAYVDRWRGDGEGALFRTTAGDRMSGPGTLDVLLTRLGARAGVKNVHPHRFRHTFATWAIESGAREIDVQMLLGHSDLTMTHRYAATYTSEKAVRAHADLSPVNRLS